MTTIRDLANKPIWLDVYINEARGRKVFVCYQTVIEMISELMELNYDDVLTETA